jgi:hypothetical protein
LLLGSIGDGFVYRSLPLQQPSDLVEPFSHQCQSQICSGLRICGPLHAGHFGGQLETIEGFSWQAVGGGISCPKDQAQDQHHCHQGACKPHSCWLPGDPEARCRCAGS